MVTENTGSERVTVRVEQLVLSNTLQLTALVELLEECGVLTQQMVLERVKQIRVKVICPYQPRGWGNFRGGILLTPTTC